MKRLLQSVACGTLITGILFVIAATIGSEKVGCVLVWQACVFDTLLSNQADRELPITFIMGIFPGKPIYAVPSYLLLRKLDSNKTR
ncbi:MAG: hypothetical protein QOJ64_3105 [Acidobacteriota bacterium]|jgi:hypothetical protein|nr:hypothetical protein [Acidobacteriota bacterium]